LKKFPKRRVSWQGSVLEKIQELGPTHTVKELAEYFGVTRGAIEHVLKLHNIPYRKLGPGGKEIHEKGI
jgi:hypothetical protein